MNALPVDCNALQSSTAKQTESKINSTVQKAKAAAPVIVVLDNFEVWQNTILTILCHVIMLIYVVLFYLHS